MLQDSVCMLVFYSYLRFRIARGSSLPGRRDHWKADYGPGG